MGHESFYLIANLFLTFSTANTNVKMSSITAGVKDFLKGSSKADTTEVCTERAPEVVQEHVRHQEQTETAEAVDRERHVHHHQVYFNSFSLVVRTGSH